MKPWVRGLIITLAVAVPAFLLGPNAPIGSQFWQPAAEASPPTPGQAPFFMLLGLMEAVTFGLAVAFLVNGRQWVNQVAGAHRGRANAMYIAIAWVLGNWWLHDNLHIVNGMNMGGLLLIEYAFHVTLMVAGGVLAANFVALIREGAVGRASASRGA